jgi:hypothetical protein
MAAEHRIGDREREAATAALNDHYANGRLDTDEHAERLDAIWSAKTDQDLALVFWDLPRAVAPAPPVRAARRRLWGGPILPVLLLVALLLMIVAKAPWWVLGIIAWVVLARTHRRSGAGACAGRGMAHPGR